MLYFKLQIFGDDGISESSFQDMEVMLGCRDASTNGIILPNTIIEYDTQIGRFGDQW